ncbi:MAG: hypothetical protein P8L21_00015 [Polaribacter sp.]|jgi:hypothetical protein|nr:hypothetical protein [Polaribacter sp.]
MSKTAHFLIKHFNNSLDLYSAKTKLYSSRWFMDFGRFGSEIFNAEEKNIYSISKKFQFWKWKMVFTIKQNNKKLTELFSKNNRYTVYSADLKGDSYQIKIHYNKKTSIFKNGEKIAEFDASILDNNQEQSIQLQLLDITNLESCFLLFSCLKIGEIEQKSKTILSSQKKLEINEDPWT